MHADKKWARHLGRFLTEGIWDIEPSSLSRMRRLGLSAVRIVHLVFKGFRDNDCPLHASALTYSSLMSIVPVLALAFSVVRGLNAGERIEQKIVASVTTLPPQFQEIVLRILEYVHRTDFATLGGVGLVLLLVIVVQVMGRVEMSFNRVWGVTTSRPLLRQFSDYLSVLVVVPVLMIGATTVNAVAGSPAIAHLARAHLGSADFLYSRLLAFAPWLVTWLAFGFLYKFMPNTRVNFIPAVVSGILGGSLWLGWQWVYITLQIGVGQYNKIYATFASVPIFLYWLYISWQIVLLGAEIGFALQNHATYKMEQRAHAASAQSRIMLALSILSHAAQAMVVKVPFFEIAAYARDHRVPVRLINEVTRALVEAQLLGELASGAGRYVLLKTPDAVRVQDVIQALLQTGASPQSLGLDRLNLAIRQVLGRSSAGSAEALKEFSITDLLQLHSRLARTETSA